MKYMLVSCLLVILFFGIFIPFSDQLDHSITLGSSDTWMWVKQTIEDNRKVNNGLIVREDGWCYAIDYAMYLRYAALQNDRPLFDSLLEGVKTYFLIESPENPIGDGSITWRVHPEREPEATGAAEMIAVMAALFEAYQLWPEPEFEALIRQIYYSFSHHQAEGFGAQWFIRDYYLYSTQTFSTAGFLFNYYPDLFFQMGEHFEREDMKALAARSLQVLRGAQIPCGLFHLIYDESISTHYGSSVHFSPNGLVKAADAAEVASFFAGTNPSRARLTLDIIKEQGFPVPHWFSTDDCQPALGEYSGVGQLAVILRLSLILGDYAYSQELIDQIEMVLQRDFINNPDYSTNSPAWTWDFTQILLALSYQNLNIYGES